MRHGQVDQRGHVRPRAGVEQPHQDVAADEGRRVGHVLRRGVGRRRVEGRAVDEEVGGRVVHRRREAGLERRARRVVEAPLHVGARHRGRVDGGVLHRVHLAEQQGGLGVSDEPRVRRARRAGDDQHAVQAHGHLQRRQRAGLVEVGAGLQAGPGQRLRGGRRRHLGAEGAHPIALRRRLEGRRRARWVDQGVGGEGGDVLPGVHRAGHLGRGAQPAARLPEHHQRRGHRQLVGEVDRQRRARRRQDGGARRPGRRCRRPSRRSPTWAPRCRRAGWSSCAAPSARWRCPARSRWPVAASRGGPEALSGRPPPSPRSHAAPQSTITADTRHTLPVRADLMAFSSSSGRLQSDSSMNQLGGSISSIDMMPPGKTSFVVISRSLCECHMYA